MKLRGNNFTFDVNPITKMLSIEFDDGRNKNVKLSDNALKYVNPDYPDAGLSDEGYKFLYNVVNELNK